MSEVDYRFAKVIEAAGLLDHGILHHELFDAIMRQVDRDRVKSGLSPLTDEEYPIIRMMLEHPQGITDQFVEVAQQ